VLAVVPAKPGLDVGREIYSGAFQIRQLVVQDVVFHGLPRFTHHLVS